jgi:hypothetical protein
VVAEGIAGQWLDISPYESGVIPDADGFLTTRTLSLETSGTFHFEDRAPEQWVSGKYSADQGSIAFAAEGSQGAPDFFQGHLSYAMLDANTLAITEEVWGGGRGFQFSRIIPVHPLIAGEWLLAQRWSSTPSLLPVLESTRLIIGEDGATDWRRHRRVEDDFLQRTGAFILTVSAHAGLRLPAAGPHPGRLYWLGACRVSAEQLRFTDAENTTTIYVRRNAPSPNLLGRWQNTTLPDTLLTLEADGTFTLDNGEQTDTGTWRTYLGNNLCLITPTSQLALAWNVQGGDVGPRFLKLGSWSAQDPDNPTFSYTQWKEIAIDELP